MRGADNENASLCRAISVYSEAILLNAMMKRSPLKEDNRNEENRPLFSVGFTV